MSVKPVPAALAHPEPAAAASQPGRTASLLTALEAATPAAAPAAELWAGLHLPGLANEQKLRALATVMQQFTPRVSLEPPDGLVLEVRGSLHLFAGVAGTRERLLAACAEHAQPAVLCFAPTPLAALVAARAGRSLTDPQPRAADRAAVFTALERTALAAAGGGSSAAHGRAHRGGRIAPAARRLRTALRGRPARHPGCAHLRHPPGAPPV